MAFAAAACSPTLATPSSHSADPSSPQAPAGRSPLEHAPETSVAAPAAPAPDPHASHHAHTHGHGQEQAAPAPPPAAASSAKPAAPRNAAPLYACPMHPEVRSNAAGLCPKCNMKLEKQP